MRIKFTNVWRIEPTSISEPGLRRRSRSFGNVLHAPQLRAAVQICEGIRAGSSFEKRPVSIWDLMCYTAT